MAQKNKSINHHWWPVGLQQYWADKNQELSWIEPDGTIKKKKFANRKIGYSRHGHTIFKGSVWESNFEKEFDIDNEVHSIVSKINELKPFGWNVGELISAINLIIKRDKDPKNICNFYDLHDSMRRNILLFLYSLLIRSPANRKLYEGYPKIIGLPPNEDVGKGNMSQSYRTAKRLCQGSVVANFYFVFLRSPLKKFIFGDGSLDWLTGNLVAGRIGGRALVPITPHLCVYVCTPMSMRVKPNCASISAAPWMVDWINEITQIYSKDKLFFLGRPPKLIDAFRQRQFLQHKERNDALIDMLDEISGNKPKNRYGSMFMSGL